MGKATFRYLHDPQTGWYEEEVAACVVCRQMRPGYGFIQMHSEGYDTYQVCEDCLLAGRLIERDLRINEGDSEALRDQLQAQRPEMPTEEREALIAARTTEVEQRTPCPPVLNLFTWPTHCGDYAVFFQQVDSDDLSQLAPDGNGKAFLISHLHPDYADVDKEFVDNVWQDRLQGFMRFYLWQCPQCSQYLLTCDSD
jgi:uncharacterized protein CbrC (UPF0167 family)